MLKTISAALLAVSVLAAPAIAANAAKTTQAPVTKSATVTPVKKNPLNANAKMGGHHHVHHHDAASPLPQEDGGEVSQVSEILSQACYAPRQARLRTSPRKAVLGSPDHAFADFRSGPRHAKWRLGRTPVF